MGILKETLEERFDYNLRERANIYAGIAMGALAPIVGMRYLMLPPSFEGEHSSLLEALAWTGSVVGNITTSIFAKGIPLLHSTIAGLTVGTFCAKTLNEKRLQKEQVLEQTL